MLQEIQRRTKKTAAEAKGTKLQKEAGGHAREDMTPKYKFLNGSDAVNVKSSSSTLDSPGGREDTTQNPRQMQNFYCTTAVVMEEAKRGNCKFRQDKHL